MSRLELGSTEIFTSTTTTRKVIANYNSSVIFPILPLTAEDSKDNLDMETRRTNAAGADSVDY